MSHFLSFTLPLAEFFLHSDTKDMEPALFGATKMTPSGFKRIELRVKLIIAACLYAADQSYL